jgi:solute carrier family 25 phosphate transporter 23/24/25/41
MVPTMDHYKGVADVFRRVLKHEGPKGLFKGIVPSFMKSIPAHGCTFLVYEYFKRSLGIEKKKKHHE